MNERKFSPFDKLEESRITGIIGDINEESTEKLKGTLVRLALQSREQIHLLIDSNGGMVLPGFSLVDTMLMIDVPIVGLVIGKCASMAVPVLQACKIRACTKHSTLFLHAMGLMRRYKFDDDFQSVLKDDEKKSEIMHNKYVDFLARRARKSREEIDRKCREGDRYGGLLFAEEALEWGLVDKVLDENFRLFRHEKIERSQLKRVEIKID